MVKLEGRIVTTRSGSKYELGEPHGYLGNALVRAVYFGEGNESPLDCVNACIAGIDLEFGSKLPIRKTAENHEVIHSLNVYIGTYPSQHGYDDFMDVIVINDLLYGLGRALNPRLYGGSPSAFRLFKTHLKQFLDGEDQ